MTIFYQIKLYVITLVGFLALDMVWLGFLARSFYRKHLGFLMAPRPHWTPAIIFYLIFVAGLLIFVVIPSIRVRSTRKVILLGIVYGIITYGTYDLTNLATIQNWPIIVTIVDMIWGIVLSMSVGIIGYLMGTMILTPEI